LIEVVHLLHFIECARSLYPLYKQGFGTPIHTVIKQKNCRRVLKELQTGNKRTHYFSDPACTKPVCERFHPSI